ncbi:MAG TPA: fused MFS/spermidine synthase [Legionella sp.]|nr:fused MFS/spermidine synthase [Legionella sp.]
MVLRFVFSFGLFLSALLLFSIQPMAAKALLPVYGGTPAVWIICMLFFQLVLLISYGYVWLLSFVQKPVIWRAIHGFLILLSLFALPILLNPKSLTGSPEWSILYALLVQLGLPLLIIGASAPLLQFAYSQSSGKGASDPYFLYAASNAGSLISLLAYPWVIERYIGLTKQFDIWTYLYCSYVILVLLILIAINYKTVRIKSEAIKKWPWYDIFYWIFLSFVPCSLMLGVTLYITTDVAATPLFWVLPLALYLLSFILTFTSKPLISATWISRNALFFLIFTILGFILGVNQVRAWQMILFNLSSFFIIALLCHGKLFASRPKPQLLALFYFCLSIGGVLAGVFNGIIAPHWFNQVYEYPLAILLSILILPLKKYTKDWWMPIIMLALMLAHYVLPEIHWPRGFPTFHVCAIIALIIMVVWQNNKFSLFLSLLILFIFLFSPLGEVNHILLQQRNFYGVKQVVDKENTHVLISQSTVHGIQNMGESKPLSGLRGYYGAVKPIIESMQQANPSLSVTLMGLGAGTLLCQFRTEDSVTVIEIDPQMIGLAKNPRLFRYLSECLPQITIIQNDGRLALAELPDASQQLIILDAFNSDAIPTHLMTLDAFNLYKRKLSEHGVILVNLSNRHLSLLPVVNAAGRRLDLMVFHTTHKGDLKEGQFDSEWMMLTANEQLASDLPKKSGWRFYTDSQQILWTDDYSNIIPLIKWY